MVIDKFLFNINFYTISYHRKVNLIRKYIYLLYIFKNNLSVNCVIINSNHIFYLFNFT